MSDKTVNANAMGLCLSTIEVSVFLSLFTHGNTLTKYPVLLQWYSK